MNSPNRRHTSYRRSVYRKNSIKTIIISALCTLLVAAVLLVVIGNIILARLDKDGANDGQDGANDPPANEHANAKIVWACAVALAADGSTLNSRLVSATANGYGEICFDLDTESGALYYKSPTATSLGKQKDAAIDLRTLSNIQGLVSANGLYATGITHISDFNSSDELVRSAAIGYHASLIAEVLRAGIDDVLIYVPELDAARYSELVLLANEVHRLAPEGHIGISLPASVYASSDGTALVDSLWQAFDYLALDLTRSSDVDADMSGMLYPLLRYNARVLVPAAEGSALANRLRSDYGAKNVMIMP